MYLLIYFYTQNLEDDIAEHADAFQSMNSYIVRKTADEGFVQLLDSCSKDWFTLSNQSVQLR